MLRSHFSHGSIFLGLTLGAVGFILGGSGLDTMWETVYPSRSVTHMMTGHAYSRAVQAHLLTSAALHAMPLSAHEQPNDEDQRKRLCSLHALLINIDCSNIMSLKIL